MTSKNTPATKTLNVHVSAKIKHKVSFILVSEGVTALVEHMDDLAADQWMPFQVYEMMRGGQPAFMIFSRKATTSTRTTES